MNPMKTSSLIAAAAVTLAVGCATNPQATYVESSGNRTISNVGQINIQDWNRAAETMINSMIAKWVAPGKLTGTGPDGRTVIAISYIRNNTSQQIDTDLLVKKIRTALLDTGKVVTDLAGGLGPSEDPLAAESKAKQQFLSNDKLRKGPDYTLSGKIIESLVRQGSLRESSYVFQLSLATPDGLAVWEGEETIVKQGKKSAVGF
jgi:penicillin-binding protein activator